MAYSSGTATDRENLLALLKTFAVAEGWTADVDTIVTNGRLSLSKNNCYVHFDTASETRSHPSNWGIANPTDNLIVAAQATAYTSATNYYGHTNSLVTSFSDANRAELRRLDTNFGYEFYSGGVGDPDYIAIICEAKSNEYVHLMFGDISKNGSFTGGEFLLNTEWEWWGQRAQDPGATAHDSFLGLDDLATSSTFFINDSNIHASRRLRLDSDEFIPVNIVAHGSIDSSSYSQSINAHIIPAGRVGPSGITPLYAVPLYISLQDALSSSDYLYLGDIPNLRLCSLEGREAKDELTIGSDTWVVYPFVKKGSVRQLIDNSSAGGTIWTNEGPSSGNAGFSIKKIT